MKKVALFCVLFILIGAVGSTPVVSPPATPVMTPQQALLILDRAASEYKGTREEHIQIQQATIVLNGFIKEHIKKPEK